MNKKYEATIKAVKKMDKNKSIYQRIGEYKKYCSLYGVKEGDASNLLAFYQHKIDKATIGLPIK